MKKIFLAIAVILSVGASVYAQNSNSCYQIQNPNRQSLCLAQAEGNQSRCYQIQHNDMQKYCLAVVGNNKNACYQIQSGDLQAQCLAQF